MVRLKLKPRLRQRGGGGVEAEAEALLLPSALSSTARARSDPCLAAPVQPGCHVQTIDEAAPAGLIEMFRYWLVLNATAWPHAA